MIDPELAEKLQQRRGKVEAEGAAWETLPEESSADAKSAGYPPVDAAARREAPAKPPAGGAPDARPKRVNGDASAPASPERPTADGAAAPEAAPEAAAADGARAAAASEAAAVAPPEVATEDGARAAAAPEAAAVAAPAEGAAATGGPPDEAALRALQERLRALGHSQEARELLRAQSPATRRAPEERVVAAAAAAEPAGAPGGGSATTSEDVAAERDECTRLAALCAPKWAARLLQGAEQQGHAQPPDASLPDADVHTIRADVQRTRAAEPAFQDAGMHERLSRLLTAFCLQEGVRYTQGLHEVAAVFAFLQAAGPSGSLGSDSVVLACFTAFIHRFVPFFHESEAFVSLHVSLLFFRQLVFYHHPDLHNQLMEAGVSPFIYATPWFITLFAARTPLSVLLRLWDRYIERGEETFLLFLAVAMLVGEKSAILAADKDDTHMAVVRAGVKNMRQLDEVWAQAEALHAQTPWSFVDRLSRVLRAIKKKRGQSKENERPWSERVLAQVERERRFVVLAEEVAASCAGAGADPPNADRAAQQEAKAEKPAPPSASLKLRFLLLDVRPADEHRAEHLPHAVHFHPPCLRRLVNAAHKGRQPRLERLAATLSAAVGTLLSGPPARQRGGEAQAQAQAQAQADGGGASTPSGPPGTRVQWIEASLVSEVLAALQAQAAERWGEDWISESACAHIVLLGGAADLADLADRQDGAGGGAVVPLYEALTEHLSLARVSVVLGGAAAVHREAAKCGVELAQSAGAEGGETARANIESFFGSAWTRLQAASEKLPPATELGGLLQSGADKARSLAGTAAHSFKEGAAIVRQQAAESAAVVRQQAAGGIAVVGHLMERLDLDFGTGAQERGEGHAGADSATGPRSWPCEVLVAERAPPGSEGLVRRMVTASLRLTEEGELLLVEDAQNGQEGAPMEGRRRFSTEALHKIEASHKAPRVLRFLFRAAPASQAGPTSEGAPAGDARPPPLVPALVARFATPELARECGRGVAADAVRRRKMRSQRAAEAEEAKAEGQGAQGAPQEQQPEDKEAAPRPQPQPPAPAAAAPSDAGAGHTPDDADAMLAEFERMEGLVGSEQ